MSGRSRMAFCTSSSLSKFAFGGRVNGFRQRDRQIADAGIEIGADLPPQHVLGLLQLISCLRQQDLEVLILGFGLVDIERGDGAQFELALSALERRIRKRQAPAPARGRSRAPESRPNRPTSATRHQVQQLVQDSVLVGAQAAARDGDRAVWSHRTRARGAGAAQTPSVMFEVTYGL